MANQTTDQEPKRDIIPCSIKMLPEEDWIAAAATAIKINPFNAPAAGQFRQAIPDGVMPPEHLAVLTTKYWGLNGVRLSVGFMDTSDTALKAKILSHMNAWGLFSNVQFYESQVNPQVRISRTPGGGYWSYLGTDIFHIPQDKATMNLDSFSLSTPDSEFFRVVRHETGHTLGFPHEHMRQEIIDLIDREKAIALFMSTQGWSREMVIAQVLTPFDSSALIATEHADPNSIMCYQLPASIMKNGVAIPGGVDIDQQDAAFVAKLYPKRSGPTFYTWRGSGTVQLNIPNPLIHAGSNVNVAISEFSTDPRSTRFIGSARMGVFNSAPYEGGVKVWAEINWSSPINICFDLLIS
ncbi:M12 family metallopeptidase [Dyadobacter sp. 3J3]|uniref:M12 family metallopeptidase n=1 Tax=Dyadobacter sp. 3J3 TaxID=2606600 RepID=UPI00135CF3CB|nr:M12 family metallopeptidase [Dyadobacter sp. 3J3]